MLVQLSNISYPAVMKMMIKSNSVKLSNLSKFISYYLLSQSSWIATKLYKFTFKGILCHLRQPIQVHLLFDWEEEPRMS